MKRLLRSETKLLQFFESQEAASSELTEHDVRSLLILIRQCLEVNRARDKYPMLYFFGNWVSHPEVDRRPVPEIIKRITDSYVDFGRSTDRIDSRFLIEDLIRQLHDFLEGYEVFLDEIWGERRITLFLLHTLSLIEDVPLVAKNVFMPIANSVGKVSRVSLKKGMYHLPDKSEVPGYQVVTDVLVPDGSGEMHFISPLITDPCSSCGLRDRKCAVGEVFGIAPGCGAVAPVVTLEEKMKRMRNQRTS